MSDFDPVTITLAEVRTGVRITIRQTVKGDDWVEPTELRLKPSPAKLSRDERAMLEALKEYNERS